MYFVNLVIWDIDIERFKPCHIALIPVGGTFTLDVAQASQLQAKLSCDITIPMHYKTERLKFPINGVEPFLSGKVYEKKDELDITLENKAAFKPVVVLNHKR